MRMRAMPESPLRDVLTEEDFVPILLEQARVMAALAQGLVQPESTWWGKRELFLLASEADELEACLDDHGARWNAHFHFFTELTASIRGLALAGLSVEHLVRRLGTYGLEVAMGEEAFQSVDRACSGVASFLRRTLESLLTALVDEARTLGALDPECDGQPFPPGPTKPRMRLPRTLGLQDLSDEDQRIAEVATKYLQACEMLGAAGLDFGEGQVGDLGSLLRERCREEHARVFEATVHNLQSAYDTHVKNTAREAADERLPRLRGHISATLHLLETMTQLVHFVERHENGERALEAQDRIGQLVPRQEVLHVILELLAPAATQVLTAGSTLAEGLLPSYTDVQSVELEVPSDVHLHARPIALMVAVVHHHGTPVRLELEGQTADASSILEVMILVGSKPEVRQLRFEGDSRPLNDLALLFAAGVGERGVEQLPDQLGYLRP